MPAFPGQTSGYIPKLNAQLIIDYSRKPDSFAVNQIVHLLPVDKLEGYYPKFDPSAQARLMAENLQVWADGQALPISDFGKQSHDFFPYSVKRYADAQAFGDLTTGMAEWDVIKQHSNVLASKAMLRRTKSMYTLLNTAGSYPTNHSATATALVGGFLGAATTTNLYIQKAFNAAANQISKATYGIVAKDSITAILSPTVAYALAATSEVREVYIQSQFADGLLQGTGQWATNYGLPPKLYGINIVVDPTLEVTSNLNTAGTVTGDWASPTNAIFFVARKGDLVGTSDLATTFASITQFTYAPMEMLLEVIPDPINKRKIVSLVDMYDMRVVAGETMFRITAALS